MRHAVHKCTPLEVVRLATPADLTQCAFEEARRLLRGDLPLMLVAAESEVRPLMDWLWENSRVTAVCLVPAEILRNPNAWALYGFRRAVICEGF